MGHQTSDEFTFDAVFNWGIEDMCSWLSRVGVSEAQGYFRERKIDGMALVKEGGRSADLVSKIKKLTKEQRKMLTSHLKKFDKELADRGNGLVPLGTALQKLSLINSNAPSRHTGQPPQQSQGPTLPARTQTARTPEEELEYLSDDGDDFTDDDDDYMNSPDADQRPPPPVPRFSGDGKSHHNAAPPASDYDDEEYYTKPDELCLVRTHSDGQSGEDVYLDPLEEATAPAPNSQGHGHGRRMPPPLPPDEPEEVTDAVPTPLSTKTSRPNQAPYVPSVASPTGKAPRVPPVPSPTGQAPSVPSVPSPSGKAPPGPPHTAPSLLASRAPAAGRDTKAPAPASTNISQPPLPSRINQVPRSQASVESAISPLSGRGINHAATHRRTPPTIATNNASEVNASKINQMNADDDTYVAGDTMEYEDMNEKTEVIQSRSRLQDRLCPPPPRTPVETRAAKELPSAKAGAKPAPPVPLSNADSNYPPAPSTGPLINMGPAAPLNAPRSAAEPSTLPVQLHDAEEEMYEDVDKGKVGPKPAPQAPPGLPGRSRLLIPPTGLPTNMRSAAPPPAPRTAAIPLTSTVEPPDVEEDIYEDLDREKAGAKPAPPVPLSNADSNYPPAPSTGPLINMGPAAPLIAPRSAAEPSTLPVQLHDAEEEMYEDVDKGKVGPKPAPQAPPGLPGRSRLLIPPNMRSAAPPPAPRAVAIPPTSTAEPHDDEDMYEDLDRERSFSSSNPPANNPPPPKPPSLPDALINKPASTGSSGLRSEPCANKGSSGVQSKPSALKPFVVVGANTLKNSLQKLKRAPLSILTSDKDSDTTSVDSSPSLVKGEQPTMTAPLSSKTAVPLPATVPPLPVPDETNPPSLVPQSPDNTVAESKMPRKPVPLPPTSSGGNPPTRYFTPSPSTSSSSSDTMDQYTWFFGKLGREEATKEVADLQQDGGFLVRRSESGGVNQPYTLCLVYKGEIFNVQIRRREDSKYTLGNPKPKEQIFSTVEEMIKFHRNNPIEVCKKGKQYGEVTLSVSPAK